MLHLLLELKPFMMSKSQIHMEIHMPLYLCCTHNLGLLHSVELNLPAMV